MKTALLCAERQDEVDCVNVAAILVRFDDGETVALTEESLRRAGLEQLDARAQLDGWARARADDFAAVAAKEST